MKRKSLLLMLIMALGAPWAAQAQFSGGTGTSTDPYKISSTNDWNTLATNVTNGTATYSGNYFQLTTDITVSTMAGTPWNPNKAFWGTFDGQNHTITLDFNTNNSLEWTAPFRYIYSATIKNVKVSGHIYTSQTKAASLVGLAQATCTITNCYSDVDIYSTASATDGTNSGLVAASRNGITISGCAFTGKLRGVTNSTIDNNGGFVGYWYNDGTVNISDCVFAPSEYSLASSGSWTFVRSNGSPNVQRCYYTQSLGNSQGTQAYKVTLAANPAAGGTVDGGTPTTDYGFVKAYSNGLLFNGVYYANGSVSLNATANDGYEFSKWNDNNTDNPRTVNVSSDASYTATFTQGGGDCAEIGTSSGNDNRYGPVNNYYNYGYYQIIYPKDEVPTGLITSIGFNYAYTSAMSKKNNVTIYMGTTSSNTLSDWMDVGEMTKVYTGNLNCTQGWNDFTLSTPYAYSGSENLVVVIMDQSGQYDGSSYTFNFATSSNDVNRYTYNDNSSNITFPSNDIGTPTISGTPNTSANYPVTRFCAVAPNYPVFIASQTDWNNFCAAVSGGNDYAGKTVIMTADVTTAVTTMAGTSSYPFKGTFNGQGHTLNVNLSSSSEGFVAPFHYVTGATIKNLKVTGNCVSSASGDTRRHNAGLVGSVVSTGVTINNCLVSTNVGSSSYKTDYCGGLIGHGHDGNIIIIGSAYTGTIYASGTNYVGGLIGWSDTPTGITITDCYFGGTYNNSSSGKFHPVGCANNGNSITAANISISNCYYNYTISNGGSQISDTEEKSIVNKASNKGKRAYSITPATNVTVQNAGTATDHNVSGITGYSTSGIKYNNTFYAGSGDNVSLNLNCTSGIADSYTTGTPNYITGTSNPYTLAMPAANVTVSSDEVISPAELPYIYGFEDNNENSNWKLVNNWLNNNNDYTNKWMIGGGTYSDGSHSLYVSHNGSDNLYNNGYSSYVYAYRQINIPDAGDYDVSFKWKAKGESGCWDAMFAALVPTGTDCPPSSNIGSSTDELPSGYINASNASKAFLWGQTDWQTSTKTVSISASGIYTLVFYWKNDGGSGDNPPAAVDDISVTAVNACAAPTNLQCTYYTTTTVTLEWTAGGDETAWVISYWPSSTNNRTDITTSDKPCTITGLTTGTLYHAQVRAVCDPDNEHWSEPISFTPQSVSYTFTNNSGSGNGMWDVANNWDPMGIPTTDDDVIIDANVTIPDDCVAKANHINVTDGAVLTIADGGQLFCNSEVTATVQKNIAKHGANAQEGGWNFIATPIVEGTTPSTTNGILSSTENDYDLFFYDEPTHYWRNYKYNDGNNTSHGFNLRNGQGYLYANAHDTQIEFTGTLRPSNAAYTNTLIYTSSVGNLAGWNLVGNPFACNATVTTTNTDSESKSCYVINGGAIVATTGTVAAPCSGVMVKATAAGQTFTFTPTTDAAVFSTGHNQLNMTIANNMTARGESSMVDNAIVSFNENSQLEKFVFFEDNAKLYIPQGEKDYAIVSAEAQGEMPVCFKATKNGEYTITVSPEGVELNYLHLIDNMTGMDVDLLQTPSYTFEASTRDYESRFKLVFAGASTDSATDESFAYYNGSEWKVSNEGEATLQVVDVIGRIVKSETINGNFSLNLNQKAGVYMLRLVNGENVKVQKVVVR